jgi:hypothetical protein
VDHGSHESAPNQTTVVETPMRKAIAALVIAFVSVAHAMDTKDAGSELAGELLECGVFFTITAGGIANTPGYPGGDQLAFTL